MRPMPIAILAIALLAIGYPREVTSSGRHHDGRRRKVTSKCDPKNKTPLDPLSIPKYVEDLVIPPVLYDDNDDGSHRVLTRGKGDKGKGGNSEESKGKGGRGKGRKGDQGKIKGKGGSGSWDYHSSSTSFSSSSDPLSHSRSDDHDSYSDDYSTSMENYSQEDESSEEKKSFEEEERSGDAKTFQVGLRQFMQQVLPVGFPETMLWGYGNPDDPSTFFNPSFTIEATKDQKIKVAWINELVNDPETCRCNPRDVEACTSVPHVVQDGYGAPIVDQTLHWANPPMECFAGRSRTDCRGTSLKPYFGPTPMVVHVHGAHTTADSDGYTEAWFLPWSASDVDDLATGGRFYTIPSESLPIHSCDNSHRLKGTGFTVGSYRNDQPTTTLWYHDHALGITRVNVFAAGAGFWLIRTQDDGESGLEYGNLPGPPPELGDDPNGSDRAKIREIPIAIQPKSFYCDGSLFYPANRAFFEGVGNDGTDFGENPELDPELVDPFNGGVSPVWNPESFFNMMVVNGRTWPKLEVAPVRYRFRILNAADSRHMNLAIFRNGDSNDDELPFYVIGSDQGLLPKVVKISTGKATVLNGDGTKPDHEDDASEAVQALLIAPAERYDVIVDFGGLDDGDEYIMINTGPDSPFGGFQDFEPADPETTGQVMKFVINEDLGTDDDSTPPEDLVFDHENPGGQEPLGDEDLVRDLALLEVETMLCSVGTDEDIALEPNNHADCPEGFESFGPLAALLGVEGSTLNEGQGAVPLLWNDPITETPELDAVEIWEFWNGSEDAHPMHLHLVEFQILGRQKFDMTDPSGELGEERPPQPFEMGWKDMVIAYPGEVTRVKAKFDIGGLFVWHCHVLSHEDNEMMRPFCVGGNCETLFS